MSTLRHGRRPVTLKELEVVYRRDGAAFEQIAGAIVGDEELGSDAVHDAFVQALRHRDRFRVDAPVEASVWRFVIGEARKRRARIARGTQPRAPQVLVAGVAVAAGASAAALAWSFGGGAPRTILQRAAATLGDGPVLHYVIRTGWSGALIDLKSGSRNYLYATEEFWYERGGRIHQISRFAGVAQGDATYAGDRRSSLNKKLGSLVTRYRQALRDGSALVLGRGVVEGHQVYWIRVDSEMLPDAHKRLHKWAHDVAVSKETFEPVAVRELRDGKPGPNGDSIVLEAESVPKGEGNFARMPRDPSGLPLKIGWTGFLTPSEASAVLGRPALWAGHSVAGLDLARIWKDERSEGYKRQSGGWAKTYTGATFFYGTLDENGDPAISGNGSGAGTPTPFVRVSESRTLDSLFQRVVTNYSPPEGSILVFDARIAVMQKDDLYFALDASSEGVLLAAARALERVPSSDTSPGSVSPSIGGPSI